MKSLLQAAAVLRSSDFRWFFAGYATSQLGSAMAPVAIAFAVIGSTNQGPGTAHTSANGLGLVMASRILPVVILLLVGGVFADRLGGRRVLIAADLIRTVAQGALAALFQFGHPNLWTLCLLAALAGIGEGVFTPALQTMIPTVTPPRHLADANRLLGSAGSIAGVGGPLLGGLLAAFAGPASVIAADAASYLVSVAVLLRLRGAIPIRSEHRTPMISDLRQGWTEFRSRGWLLASSIQFCLFNALVWAPFLVLGPLAAEQNLSGPKSWGLILCCEDLGVVIAGLALLGREPRRPMFWATILSAGYALPGAALATHAALPWVCLAALACGLMTAAVPTSATVQRHVPAEVLGRVTAYQYLGAFALGPAGLAVAGPLADAFGLSALLTFGAAFQLVSALIVLAVPSIRSLRSHPEHPDGPVLSDPSDSVFIPGSTGPSATERTSS